LVGHADKFGGCYRGPRRHPNSFAMALDLVGGSRASSFDRLIWRTAKPTIAVRRGHDPEVAIHKIAFVRQRVVVNTRGAPARDNSSLAEI
jgi:hypothetical protein